MSHNENKHLRRISLDKMQPAELAIYNAMQEVEKIGADVRLTRAIILLTDAKKLVSDFIDDLPVVAFDGPPNPQPPPATK